MIECRAPCRTETGRNCKVMMDLAGPKLRTGTVAFDQSIVHLQAFPQQSWRHHRPRQRDPRCQRAARLQRKQRRAGTPTAGTTRRRAGLAAAPEEGRPRSSSPTCAARKALSSSPSVSPNTKSASPAQTTAYLEENISLKHIAQSKHHPVFETFIGTIAATPTTILLREGDLLKLTRAATARRARRDRRSRQQHHPRAYLLRAARRAGSPAARTSAC